MEDLEAETYPGVNTLFHAFKRNVERIPNNEMLGTRVEGGFKWKSWSFVDDQATNISYGLEAFKLAPEIEAEGITYKFIGIQSKNREEWTTLHIANMHQSITTVAFYDTLGPEASKFMIDQTEMTTIAVSKDYIPKLTKMKNDDEFGKMKSLQNIIVFEEDTPEEHLKEATDSGFSVYTLKQIYEKGKEVGGKFIEPKPETCAAFSYTSGTTGDPKGVKLTHQMLLQTCLAVKTRFDNSLTGSK